MGESIPAGFLHCIMYGMCICTAKVGYKQVYFQAYVAYRHFLF